MRSRVGAGPDREGFPGKFERNVLNLGLVTGNVAPFRVAFPMSLRIQCPSCRRQFKVDEELQGRTVECGACEKQFVVDNDAVVSERGEDRYFPGDIQKPGLDHYARATPSSPTSQSVQFATATYNDAASAADVTPVSPQRIFAGALGIGIQVLFALALVFGTQENWIMYDVEPQKRLVLAGFVVAVGACLIFVATRRRRMEGLLAIGGLGATVICLAAFLGVDQNSENVIPPPPLPDVASNPDTQGPKRLTEADVKNAMGYGPVASAIESAGVDRVVALWAPTMRQRFKFQIRNYLQRKCETPELPSFNERPNSGGIFIIENTPLSIAEVEQVVSNFAEIEEVYRNLRVFQIVIKSDNLGEMGAELKRKVDDPSHAAFYKLNQTELDHLVLKRVQEAAQRLSQAEPKRFRNEIGAKLLSLLDEDESAEFREAICEAIAVWSVPGDGAEAEVARVAQDLLINGGTVPRTMIEFLISRKSGAVVALLEELWKSDPASWESTVVSAGSPMEEVVIPYLKSESNAVLRSALVILRRLGTAASIPALEAALEAAGDDDDLKILINAAIDSIKNGSPVTPPDPGPGEEEEETIPAPTPPNTP